MIRVLGLIILGLWFTGCSITISVFPAIEPLQEKVVQAAQRQTDNKILLLDIEGVLFSQEYHSLFFSSRNTVAEVKERLRKAERDPQIKAVVIRVNSPGGEVTACDTIYHELKRFKRRTGTKIIVCMTNIATSGGYYISMVADKIVAHPNCITGSIGVISILCNVEGLLNKVGIKIEVIKAGQRKDIGSPYRKMLAEERKLLQRIIDQMYEGFLKVVREGRPNLSEEEIHRLADGMIFTARQALQHGLIDWIGFLPGAIQLAKQEAKLPHADVIMYHRPGEYIENIYSEPVSPGLILPQLSLKTLLKGESQRFYYLWLPGYNQ
jgi:protease-4